MKQEELLNKNSYSLKQIIEHVSFCYKNDIIIYVVPTNRWNEVCIEINYKGEIIKKSQIYKQQKLKPKDVKYHKVIYELYTSYYEQLNNIK